MAYHTSSQGYYARLTLPDLLATTAEFTTALLHASAVKKFPNAKVPSVNRFTEVLIGLTEAGWLTKHNGVTNRWKWLWRPTSKLLTPQPCHWCLHKTKVMELDPRWLHTYWVMESNPKWLHTYCVVCDECSAKGPYYPTGRSATIAWNLLSRQPQTPK